MKRLPFSRMFALMAALVFALSAGAYDFVANGFYYNITGTNTVEVTSNPSQYSGDVTIPSTVTYSGKTYQVTAIAEGAFQSCTDLTAVIIPNTVITIRQDAFYGCSALECVIIGSGVTAIGHRAFKNCHYSALVCLATTPPAIESDSFDTQFVDGNKTGPVVFLIPRGYKDTYDTDERWSNCYLSDNAFDFFVNGIFYNITDERTVEVAKSPYYSNWYKGSVSIPSMTSYNGTVYRVTGICDEAFYNCLYLTSVTIPTSVTTIGSYAFAFCIGLTEIAIPNTVTTIGDYAFGACSGLISMSIGSMVTSIGENIFASCTALANITVANDNPVYDSRNNCNAIIETASNTLVASCINTVIPNTVTAIGAWVFAASGITSITIPNSVTTIGDYAFVASNDLASVTIGSGVTSIGYAAFSDCSALTNVVCLATTPPEIITERFPTFDDNAYSNATLTVPRGCKATYQAAAGWRHFTTIKEISYDFAVNGICYNITGTNTVEVTENPALYSGNVNIPSTVTYGGKTYQVTGIGAYAFEACTGLTSVAIPASVTYIGDAAFTSCGGLTTVIIPASVTTIGWYAFSYCDHLTSVTIGSGVTSIGGYAFTECPALTSVTCLAATPPTITQDVFDSLTYGNATLKVPNASMAAYRAATGWKLFTHVIGVASKGDLTGDGFVNVADVTTLISYILNSVPVSLDMADMNNDGQVNVADVTALIQIVLNN